MKKVVGCAIVRGHDLLLLWKKNKSHYEFPGGLALDTETNEQTAIREAKEEIGRELHNVQFFDTYKANFGMDQFEFHVMVGQINGEPQLMKPQDFDHFKWVNMRNSNTVRVAPNVAEFIKSYLSRYGG